MITVSRPIAEGIADSTISRMRGRPQMITSHLIIGAIEETRSEEAFRKVIGGVRADSMKSQMGTLAGEWITGRMRRHRTEVPLFLSSERLSTSWATSHRGWPRSCWSRGLKGDGAMGWP